MTLSKDGKKLTNFHPSDVKDGIITIPEGVKEIASHATATLKKHIKFKPTEDEKRDPYFLKLINGRDEINDTLAQSDTSVKKIIFPSSLKILRPYSLTNLDGIEEIDIPDCVQIGKGVCSNCRALKRVVLPNETTIIPEEAFYNCCNLTKVSVRGKKNKLNSAIPNCITQIGKHAFEFTAIKRIESDSLQIVDEQAFASCQQLKSVNLKNVETIGCSAFNGCTQLVVTLLGDTIQLIGDYAFAHCHSLGKPELIEINPKTQEKGWIGFCCPSSAKLGKGVIIDTKLYNDKKAKRDAILRQITTRLYKERSLGLNNYTDKQILDIAKQEYKDSKGKLTQGSEESGE